MDLRKWLIKSDKTKRDSSTGAATGTERPKKRLKTNFPEADQVRFEDDIVQFEEGDILTSSDQSKVSDRADTGNGRTAQSQTPKQDPKGNNNKASDEPPLGTEDHDNNSHEHEPKGKDTRGGNNDHNTECPKIDNPNSEPASQPKLQPLQIIEKIGDIFTAPPNTLIIHACNCRGSWGGGIAAAFRKHYPNAFTNYHAHCERFGFDLMGSAQLIPPVETAANRGKHFVGCLFTSRRFGKLKDSPERILDATGPAMADLLGKVKKWNEEHGGEDRVGEVRMCLINSGLFAVDWSETKAVLESLDAQSFDVKTIVAMDRE